MHRDGFPGLLKRWRNNRRLSQEQLAFDAEISTRHMSYLETGKSQPSREMVLVLASALDLELRERNVLLGSAGFAPVYTSSPWESLEMAPVRKAVDLLLESQEPFGAVLIDRCWNLLKTNRGAQRLFARFLNPDTFDPTIAGNMVRAVLHPNGLRSTIVNWKEVAAIAVERLERECALCPYDEDRRALREEVWTYPDVKKMAMGPPTPGGPMATLHLKKGADEVRLFTMLTTIGTPQDVTAQEMSLESFFPADEATETWYRKLADDAANGGG